jgi:hypothetical protein
MIPEAEAVGLEPTNGHAATCFQDRLLIQPDDFRCKLRELESNQRPPGSEPGVTTNSDYPASISLYDTHDIERFAGSCEGRNRTCELLVQSQASLPTATASQY